MSLRDLAYNDLRAITTDSVTGFGWSITLTDPAGVSTPITGLSNDIALVIDPDTGTLVSGRAASISLSMAELAALGVSLPEGVADSASKPWVVEFNDIGGTTHLFKVSESNPDRAIGNVTCMLELYT